MVSKINQANNNTVQIEIDCTGVHCYDTKTDHIGDEVILTVTAPASLRDHGIIFPLVKIVSVGI